jgi:phenylalanyl-tRNA synthetase beta chain
MHASTLWINDYLDRPADADELATLLTRAGFPVDSREEVTLANGVRDVRQDFETTSNRGDCLSHIGLAREAAAMSGRSLRLPKPANRAAEPRAATIIRVTNRETQACPLYTARVIRGVTVKPSPDWLADRLRAIGQIPRNNIVDATNFVLFELGQPTHVFDLAKIRGGEIIIRRAANNEPFLPIGEGEKERRLHPEDVVIADAAGAVAIGGVKGGALSAVSGATKDILIEAATFDPGTVRRSRMRHRIESASAYRYERGVHAAQVNPAAERLVELILKVAGGTLCEGVVSDGAAVPAARTVSMRPARCRKIIGADITESDMVAHLARLGFQPRVEGDSIRCLVPCERMDVDREIDLIEEVARMHGLDRIPMSETIAVRVEKPQAREAARRAVRSALTGMGFVESVTHSLIAERAARPFAASPDALLRIDDERATAEPILRPSLIPSLLRVRATNRDRGVNPLRLFEWASTFEARSGEHRETRRIGLVADVESAADGTRPIRGVVERVITVLLGSRATCAVAAASDVPWLRHDAQARVTVAGESIGCLGIVADEALASVGLEQPMLVAEIEVEPFLERYPPDASVAALPAFPAIERDVSAIVDEAVTWRDIAGVISGVDPPMLDSTEFVTTYRGRQIGEGRKSVTIRLRFRAPDRTLTHGEVDPQMDAATKALQSLLGATIRA